MAVRQNNLQFKKAQFTFEEDGRILIHEIKKDTVETFDLTDAIRDFSGDGRFVDLTFREVFDVEGLDE